MSQVTIYLDEKNLRQVKRAAKSSGQSVSHWMSTLIDRELHPQWPLEVRESAGTWADFPFPEALRPVKARDLKREKM